MICEWWAGREGSCKRLARHWLFYTFHSTDYNNHLVRCLGERMYCDAHISEGKKLRRVFEMTCPIKGKFSEIRERFKQAENMGT